jgi:hypothetical protein
MTVSERVVAVYADLLQEMFPELNPTVEDLFLLGPHQIASLPERAPGRELAAVLHAHPLILRFLIRRHPPSDPYLNALLAEHGPVSGPELAASERTLVWELADWIAYQRAPGAYDEAARIEFDLAAITDLVPLAGKVLIDAGAGTGRVALAAAPVARHVYAVEPVASLRGYMRTKGIGLDNLFVLDGFLHAIPLPARSADVLVTCEAIGWQLDQELREIERILKPGGIALHLFGSPEATESSNRLFEALGSDGYRSDPYRKGTVSMERYLKQMAAVPEATEDPVG